MVMVVVVVHCGEKLLSRGAGQHACAPSHGNPAIRPLRLLIVLSTLSSLFCSRSSYHSYFLSPAPSPSLFLSPSSSRYHHHYVFVFEFSSIFRTTKKKKKLLITVLHCDTLRVHMHRRLPIFASPHRTYIYQQNCLSITR